MELAGRPLLRRIVALDRMVRTLQYPNSQTAARALEVCPRTIHRDFDFLRDSLGTPLEFSRAHNGFYYRDPDYALPLVRITEGELIALFLAERVLHEYQGTPYAADLARAFTKLTATLAEPVTIDLAHLDQAFSFRRHAAPPADPKVFRRLVQAIREGRQLELVYWTASRDQTNRRLVDPYHLASVQGEWYLVANCHLRE
jgi:predicted DNA-binding transcriptional regulator YafY